MAFVFYQLYQKENCNKMKQFKVSLEKFSNGGVCFFQVWEKNVGLFVVFEYHHVC